MSKASDIAAALTERLEAIREEANCLTDIGRKVFRGKRKLDEGCIPCAVIVEGDDKVEGAQPGEVKLSQNYILEGHAKCDPDHPNDTAHKIIADLKKAIFSVERGEQKLGGICIRVAYKGRIISPREDGLDLVSAAIEIEVVFVEKLAEP